MTIDRAGALRHAMRRYRVVVDGVQIGTVANGAARAFAVDAGDHVIRVLLNQWCQSPQRRLVARDGAMLTFRCNPTGGPTFSVWSLFVSTSDSIDLEQVNESPKPRAAP